jgi:ABC-type antimicrobial peptide transport system permease subunit
VISALHGAFVEAWQEIRIHKVRVILSLIGVGVAVATLTLVVAMSAIGRTSIRENFESVGGRDSTLTIAAFRDSGDEVTAQELRRWVAPVLEHYDITYASLVSNAETIVKPRNKPSFSTAIDLVDPQRSVIYPMPMIRGRWLSASDAGNRSPALVVSEDLEKKLGLHGKKLPASVEIRDQKQQPMVWCLPLSLVFSRASATVTCKHSLWRRLRL